MSRNSISFCGDRLPSPQKFCHASIHSATSDPFLSLFPHRFDYIFAHPPQPHHSPRWQTERRYPLSDRLIDQSAFLYGVRFGSHTRYCLLDIDWGSAYHPRRDPLAIASIHAALEPLGLVSSLTCSSSDSGGIHLYFPFEPLLKSWELAQAVSALLAQAGFKIAPGQLEIFPNPKPYVPQGKPGLFNAHRLPLQVGSYLLDDQFQPMWSDRHSFVQHWQFAALRNDINEMALRRIVKQQKRSYIKVSGKAEKFLQDLNTEIEAGWTDHGQTNYLLGKIAMRTYVFHHLLTGEAPLEGQPLVDQIVAIAIDLPGYQNWCNHQTDIVNRAEEWARCVENSHYFHYGLAQGKYKPQSSESDSELGQDQSVPSWNERQRERVRDRIKTAMTVLESQPEFPQGTTDRFQYLTKQGISGRSLYRHRDLWHPEHQTPEPEPMTITTNLLSNSDGNVFSQADSEDFQPAIAEGNVEVNEVNTVEVNKVEVNKVELDSDSHAFLQLAVQPVERQTISPPSIPVVVEHLQLDSEQSLGLEAKTCFVIESFSPPFISQTRARSQAEPLKLVRS